MLFLFICTKLTFLPHYCWPFSNTQIIFLRLISSQAARCWIKWKLGQREWKVAPPYHGEVAIVSFFSAFCVFLLKVRYLCWPKCYYNAICFFCFPPPPTLFWDLTRRPQNFQSPTLGGASLSRLRMSPSSIRTNYVTSAEKERAEGGGLPLSSMFEVFCNWQAVQLGAEKDRKGQSIKMLRVFF